MGSNVSELVLEFSVAVLQGHKTKEPKEIFDIFSVVLQKGLLKTIDTPSPVHQRSCIEFMARLVHRYSESQTRAPPPRS